MATVLEGEQVFLTESITTIGFQRTNLRCEDAVITLTFVADTGEKQTMTVTLSPAQQNDLGRFFLGAPIKGSPTVNVDRKRR